MKKKLKRGRLNASPLPQKIRGGDKLETFVCKGKRMKRKNVVITLDPEIVEKAKKLGLNISKVCENALVQAVNSLETVFSEKGGNLGTIGSRLEPRAGFEPATTGLQGRRYTGLSYRGPFYGFMDAK